MSKETHYSIYKSIRFLAITEPFLTNWAEIVYGSSRDYYLTNPGFGPYLPFSILWTLQIGAAPQSGASKTDQKVDTFGEPFGSPVISKSCFQLFL